MKLLEVTAKEKKHLFTKLHEVRTWIEFFVALRVLRGWRYLFEVFRPTWEVMN